LESGSIRMDVLQSYNKEVYPMIDTKMLLGAAMTAAGASAGYLDIAEPIVTITMTVVVGCTTIWYTVERALKIRRERKDS
jgi:hypothetical protein